MKKSSSMRRGIPCLVGSILTAIAFMGVLTGCGGKRMEAEELRITAFADGKDGEVVEMLRNGDIDCGYGPVSSENAVHYGILKSDVMERREMMLISEKRILNSEDLSGLAVGYPDDLEDAFSSYLQAVPDAQLHAYASRERLVQDLRAGLLDVAAMEMEEAFEILHMDHDWQASQPYGLPVLEYRYISCRQEYLDQAAALRKEQ